MDEYILMLVSMLACLISGMFKKVFTNRFTNDPLSNQVFNLVTFTAATVLLICWGGFSGFSWFTFLLAVAFGVITALQQLSLLKAMNCGPWSYTSVITALSTLIPAISGVLFWHESIQWPQIVGIILMVICFFLSVDTKRKEKSASRKWLMWCLVVFVCTGLIGVIQKWHQSSAYKLELNSFLIFSFIMSSVYSLVCCVGIKLKSAKNVPFMRAFFGRKTDCRDFSVRKELLSVAVIMLLVGGTSAINNKLNLYLSGVMDSAVFFPIMNGGGLVLTTIVSAAVFKEKLSNRQWIGLTAGIVSVIFLANPFA